MGKNEKKKKGQRIFKRILMQLLVLEQVVCSDQSYHPPGIKDVITKGNMWEESGMVAKARRCDGFKTQLGIAVGLVLGTLMCVRSFHNVEFSKFLYEK